MTQIQGRIKTVVDYSEQNSALGVCCKPDGTKESQLKSLNECNQLGGKWVASSNIDSVVCPQPGERGCCCSCSYTTKNTGTDSDWTHPDHYNIIPIGRLGSPNGLRGDISKCECEYLNGNWSAGSCPEGDSIESAIDRKTRCATDGIEERDDVRWPFSCCSCKEDSEGNLIRDCTSVCSSADCVELQNVYYPANDNCAGEYDIFRICDYSTLAGREPKLCSQAGPILPGSVYDGIIQQDTTGDGDVIPFTTSPPTDPPTAWLPSDLNTDLIGWYIPEDISFNSSGWNNRSSRGGNFNLLGGLGQKPESLTGNSRIYLGKNEYDIGFCNPLSEQLEPWENSGVRFNSFYYRGEQDPSATWAGDYDLNAYHYPFNPGFDFAVEKNKDYVVVAVHQSIFQSGIQPLKDPNDSSSEGFYLDNSDLDDGTILAIGRENLQNNTNGPNYTSFKANHLITDSSSQTTAIAKVGPNVINNLGSSFSQTETVIDPQPRFTIWHMRQSKDVRDVTINGDGTNLSSVPRHHMVIKQLGCNGQVISSSPRDYRFIPAGENEPVDYENRSSTVTIGSELLNLTTDSNRRGAHINLIELFVIKIGTATEVIDPSTGNPAAETVQVLSDEVMENIISYLKTKYVSFRPAGAGLPRSITAPINIESNKEKTPLDYGQILAESPDSSACCTLNKTTNKFECSMQGRAQCEARNGFYSIPSETSGPILCSNVKCPDAPTVDTRGNVIPPSIKSSDLPEPGSMYAGGVYIGNFQPGVSTALVNLETGASVQEKTVTLDGPGQTRKWALIACPSDLGDEFGVHNLVYQHTSASEDIPQELTSTYDGLFNTFGDGEKKLAPNTHLYRQIRNFNRFGFSDWYLPSIQELGFITARQKDLNFGVNLIRYSQNQQKLSANEAYLSSTRKKRTSANKRQLKYPAANLVYGMLIGNKFGPLNGFTVLTGLDNIFRVRLVRRIYVED